MSKIKPAIHWVLSKCACHNHHLVLKNDRLLYYFVLGLMGNKMWSQLLSSEEKGVWPLRRKKSMTRGLMCIPSKMPGWRKKSTCNESRAHIPGIGNDKEEKSSICRQCQLPNSIIPWNKQKSDQPYNLHAAWKPHWQDPAHSCRTWSEDEK